MKARSISLDKHVIEADNPFIRTYDAWRAFVGSTALVLQAYIAPSVEYFLRPGQGLLSSTTGDAPLLGFTMAVLAFVLSAGAIFSLYVQTLILLYKKRLWYLVNRRFVIMGRWDLRFVFQDDDPNKRSEPTGFIIVDQDHLGRAEVSGFYDYSEELGRYRSEFTMSGTPFVDGARPSYRFFYKTIHYGDSGFIKSPDIAEGVEIVAVSKTSELQGYPTRMAGVFAIYRRTREQALWNGHTFYSRSDELRIQHEIK